MSGRDSLGGLFLLACGVCTVWGWLTPHDYSHDYDPVTAACEDYGGLYFEHDDIVEDPSASFMAVKCNDGSFQKVVPPLEPTYE